MMHFRLVCSSILFFTTLTNAAYSSTVTGTTSSDFFDLDYDSIFVNENVVSLSGYSVTLFGTYGVISNSYFGLGGEDYLISTNNEDYINLDFLNSVENVIMANGSDVVYAGAIGQPNLGIYGGDGNDILFSGAGNDIVYGGFNEDILDGGPGNDELWGNYGDDVFIPSLGTDLVDGGENSDTILFYSSTSYNILDAYFYSGGSTGAAINGGCSGISTNYFVILYTLSGVNANLCATNIENIQYDGTVYSLSSFASAFEQNVSTVPLPASIWALLSALGGLALMRRRHGGQAG